MSWVIVWWLACAGRGAAPAAATADDPAAAAADAYRASDWPRFVELQQRVVDADPASSMHRYNLACGLARAGRTSEAVVVLAGLLAQGIDYGIAQDPDLASVQGDPALAEAMARYDVEFPPIDHGTRAFVVGEDAELVAEGVAYDPATERFFVGSMRTGQVYAVTGGAPAPFGAPLTLDGLPLSAIGMTVDRARGRLWVCGTATELLAAPDPARFGTAALIGLDLATGEARETYRPTGPTRGFNDVALGPDGSLYLSGGDVFVVRPGDDAASLLGVQPPIRDSNGIAVGPAGVLYVSADHQGIARVDLSTGQREWVGGRALRPFDGLYAVDGALVGVEMGVGRGRVVRVDLDPNGTSATAVHVLQQRHPSFGGITTGVVVGTDLYFLGVDREVTTEVWRAPLRP